MCEPLIVKLEFDMMTLLEIIPTEHQIKRQMPETIMHPRGKYSGHEPSYNAVCQSGDVHGLDNCSLTPATPLSYLTNIDENLNTYE